MDEPVLMEALIILGCWITSGSICLKISKRLMCRLMILMRNVVKLVCSLEEGVRHSSH